MPFTANRQFKAAPRLLARAEGMHYFDPAGRRILDGTSGLWCVNAGHGRAEIADAVAQSLRTLDYAPPFQMGHPPAFQAAEALTRILPAGLDAVFFTNSGSESVETALKIARAYHRANGQPDRVWLVGRERGYHGVNFGGISVGGIANNKAAFGPLLGEIDHLRSTHDPTRNAMSRGQPALGADLADDLERIVASHGAGAIAAVIVEPMAGSTGVLVAPQGYLQRLRELCTKHGILLIFDEVITGFGRLGAATAAERYGVTPDMITLAKGITNGAVPMGAVAIRGAIRDALMTGPEAAIELFHGYTYSGHPTACAAALATLDIYRREGLFQRAADLAPYWQDAVHSLAGVPTVIDVRNDGLVAGIELESRPDRIGSRAYDVLVDCFERGLLIRVTGDIIALSPPLIVERAQIDELIDTLRRSLQNVA